MQNILIVIGVIILGALLYINFAQAPVDLENDQLEDQSETVSTETGSPSNEQPVANADISIATPAEGALVASPIELSGEARGYWYFEASAPVEVLDNTGTVIGQSFVTATGNWMTEDFVPFTGTVNYTLPAGVTGPIAGTVVFKRDNPSGLPENDASVSVPVQLQ